MSDLEAQSRLRSVRAVIEHEGHALAALKDERLDRVLHAIEELEAAITMSLTMYAEPDTSGR